MCFHPLRYTVEGHVKFSVAIFQDARRAGPMHRFVDPRVDVCVYFVAPHRCKKVDVRFMTELSKHVPVVPVLAKVRPRSLMLFIKGFVHG